MKTMGGTSYPTFCPKKDYVTLSTYLIFEREKKKKSEKNDKY